MPPSLAQCTQPLVTTSAATARCASPVSSAAVSPPVAVLLSLPLLPAPPQAASSAATEKLSDSDCRRARRADATRAPRRAEIFFESMREPVRVMTLSSCGSHPGRCHETLREALRL